MSLPYFPLYVADYALDTMHLSTVEHGAYLLLLMQAWSRPGCALPDDDALMRKLTRLDAKGWAKIKPTVMAFWDLEDGYWTQGRLKKEWDRVTKLADVARSNGKKGGRPKSLEKQGVEKPTGFVSVNPAETQPLTIQNQNQNQIKTPPKGGSKKPDEKSARQWLETVLSADRAEGVLEHRQRLRKPLTANAARLLAGKFAECPDANQAADLMVLNGWQGCEPAWVARHLEEAGRSARPHRQPTLSEAFGAIARMETRDDLDSNPAGAIVLDLPALRHN